MLFIGWRRPISRARPGRTWEGQDRCIDLDYPDKIHNAPHSLVLKQTRCSHPKTSGGKGNAAPQLSAY